MPTALSGRIEHNIALIQKVFDGCDDLTVIPWQYGPEMASVAVSVYFDTLVLDKSRNHFKQLMQDLVAHEIGPGTEVTAGMIRDHLTRHAATRDSAFLIEQAEDLVRNLMEGCLVVLVDGWNRAVGFHAGRIETRQVSEPLTEPVVQGPRESTVENLRKNIGMIRKRLQHPNFKLAYRKTGGYSKTMMAYGYLDGVVDPNVLAEFKKRLSLLPEGDILETSYIEDCLEDSGMSPFPQFRYTERTDVAAAALLNGKIIVLVEGTGSILICPGLFFELLQSSEDYYQRTLFANAIRWMRIAAFLIALMLPSLYIAVSTFHPELIPTVLLLAIIDTREGIPFPAFAEAVLMTFTFELLREAGIRLPRPVGSAVSIVGALVVGEAAINAGIASPIMVVVTALTGIASFSLPQYNFAIALRLVQLPLMILAALLGGFGLMIGYLLLWIHLVNLKSLGVPYMMPLAPWVPGQIRDTFYRKPLKSLAEKRKMPSGPKPQPK
ncbi:spore germination protein [Paenibacillus humicola]|uniref:spore germination protein n=1 Tax=Paenibacillus humicola TaxID=3110540 RepID=UPI00237B3007|nr:spore germination protein [Paenibacillus humicola]